MAIIILKMRVRLMTNVPEKATQLRDASPVSSLSMLLAVSLPQFIYLPTGDNCGLIHRLQCAKHFEGRRAI